MISPTSEGCQRLCPGCPLVPSGVTAELTRLAMLTEQEMRDYKYGQDAPAGSRLVDENLSKILRATFTVVESTNPEVEAGNEAEILIHTYGMTHEKVRESFSRCDTPTRPNILARAFGATAICNGLPSSFL